LKGAVQNSNWTTPFGFKEGEQMPDFYGTRGDQAGCPTDTGNW
jgi:hypothetical protein